MTPNIALANHSRSTTEQTIVQHTNLDTKPNERPLPIKQDGNKYPTNPNNGYISLWADGLQGCLTCASTHHRFVACPKKDDLATKINIMARTLSACTFLRDDWILLFNETKYTVSYDQLPTKVICDDRIIIDNILLFSNHMSVLLHYFPCVSQVFTKYRLSFKLSKCNLFQG